MTRKKSRRILRQTLFILAAMALSTYCIVANFPEVPPLPRVPFASPTPAPSLLPNEADDVELLRLVNPWNTIPQEYTVTLVQLRNDQAVDERCYPALQAMMDDCRAAGLSPLICSSYRSGETQAELYHSKVAQLEAQGLSRSEAETEAAKIVAVPGTSEHQLGLAVDIVDESYQHLDERQENTAVQQWLMAHSWEYGFILRYPTEKSETTGIIYEPWHYRYVGKSAARAIQEQSLCLEEYLDAAEFP